MVPAPSNYVLLDLMYPFLCNSRHRIYIRRLENEIEISQLREMFEKDSKLFVYAREERDYEEELETYMNEENMDINITLAFMSGKIHINSKGSEFRSALDWVKDTFKTDDVSYLDWTALSVLKEYSFNTRIS